MGPTSQNPGFDLHVDRRGSTAILRASGELDILGAERSEPPRRRSAQSRRVLGSRDDQHAARGQPIEVPGWLAHVIEHQQRRLLVGRRA